MTEILNLRHERIDDVPLLLGVGQQLGLADILNRHLGTHGLQQGLHNGQLAVGWLTFILSQADHRKSAVRDWANGLSQTLSQAFGRPLREVDFSDDRLGNVAQRLSDEAAWDAIEQELWAATMNVYELSLSGVRLDSTTSYGFHQPDENGVMQRGHSKDHRPDLAQLKLMAAVAEPTGQLMCSAVHNGSAADDPLYMPLIHRVRRMVNRTGLLYSGDCKMAALNTRAELVAGHDYYLMPLPLTGENQTLFTRAVEAIVAGEQAATLLWNEQTLLGAGYELVREQSAIQDGQPLTWSERVLIVRSNTLAQKQRAHLEQRLTKATAALLALTPAVARGKRQIREEAALTEAINTVLERHEVKELLAVKWERQEHTRTHHVGRGRPAQAGQRTQRTHTEVRYVITAVERIEAAITARQHRLGWRMQATNASVERLNLTQAVLHYRGGWTIERDFHLLKAQPLGFSPLFVWKDEQIIGVTHLLTLALRLLTLIESQVRHGQKQNAEEMRGLYEGQPNRTTTRPTSTRLLKAFVRAPITLTCIETSAGVKRHVTPLSELQLQILRLLRLPSSLYAAISVNSE